MSEPPRPRSPSRMRGLRANSFAATVVLVVEYGLGMWVNLYGHLPASDHGANVPDGFARAVADGPVVLALHALLAMVLIGSAITAVVRSVLVHRPSFIAVTSVGLVAIVVAALSGVGFVGRGGNASSMAMAVAAGVAIGSYALILFVAGGVATVDGP